MDHEPDRDPSEAEAVRLYLEAIEVPPLPWAGIEASARRLRARRRGLGHMPWLAGAAVAAALLIAIAGQALAPRRTLPPPRAAFSTLDRGAAMTTRTGAGASPGNAAAKGPRHGTFSAAALPVAPVPYGGHTYRLLAAPVPLSELGQLLAGQPPKASTWQVPGRVPAHASDFHVLAVYGVKGRSPAAEIAVLGRFGSSPPSLWEARRAARRQVPRA